MRAIPMWDRVLITETCWLWTGPLSKKGYGATRGQRAHRAVYERLVRKLQPGEVIDHLCRVPNCVRPDHLEPVTARENTLRGYGPTALNARKTHCKHGHELSGWNLIIRKDGRECRTCLYAHIKAGRTEMSRRGVTTRSVRLACWICTVLATAIAGGANAKARSAYRSLRRTRNSHEW